MRLIFPASLASTTQDGAAQDGAAQDGAAQDGAPQDGGAVDSVSEAALAALYAYPELSGNARPWVRANMVASVDGAATAGGRSGGLSGAADRAVFALLRSLAD